MTNKYIPAAFFGILLGPRSHGMPRRCCYLPPQRHPFATLFAQALIGYGLFHALLMIRLGEPLPPRFSRPPPRKPAPHPSGYIE
jgi:hypothetical protein